MKISGVIPLRNAVTLGYPFILAVRSLQMLCDEVVVLVDPTSEDGTLSVVKALCPDKIVESVWDMSNHQGHTNCEISVQTTKACEAATGDWIFSLQADELLHERDISAWRQLASHVEGVAATAIEAWRLYFYGALSTVRVDWTIPMVRFFKRGCWTPDIDGAMRFDPIGRQDRSTLLNPLEHAGACCIYHYSRVGAPEKVAERVRNLDRFFHAPEKVEAGKLPPYDFSALRKLDTYVIGSLPEVAENARLVPFAIEDHPKAAQEFYR